MVSVISFYDLKLHATRNSIAMINRFVDSILIRDAARFVMNGEVNWQNARQYAPKENHLRPIFKETIRVQN
jgi:hypothetical protein